MHAGWKPATEVYEDAIRAALRPGMRVIDVGCGRGGVLEQLGGAVSKPVGLDPDLLSLREHRMPDLPRAAAMADALPFKDACADLVLSSWVLEHIEQPHVVFAEMHRVLKPGGQAIVLTPNARSVIALLNRGLRPLQTWLVPRLYGRAEADTFRVRYRANTAGALRRFAAQTGLTCTRFMHIEDPTYLAFHPLLFRFSVILAQVTIPVHLIAILQKR